MGLSFSSENKTKKRKEERVPYIDKKTKLQETETVDTQHSQF